MNGGCLAAAVAKRVAPDVITMLCYIYGPDAPLSQFFLGSCVEGPVSSIRVSQAIRPTGRVLYPKLIDDWAGRKRHLATVQTVAVDGRQGIIVPYDMTVVSIYVVEVATHRVSPIFDK